MKKIYILITASILISGCQLNNTSESDSEWSDISSPYEPYITSGRISARNINVLENYDNGSDDIIKYMSKLSEKTECLTATLRSMPIQCNDSTASNTASNCTVWSAALASAANKQSKEIASVDDKFYTSQNSLSIAKESGYSGDFASSINDSFYLNNASENRIISKAFENAIKSTNGSCSKFMTKRVNDISFGYKIKDINGKKKIFTTIFMGESYSN